MVATLLAAPRSLLLILLLAGLHSASAALIRPLFQVSDEVTYLASLERAALSLPHDAALAPCLSPPDGAPPAWMPEGGKWLFHAIGGRILRLACVAGAGSMAPLWVRLVFSLSLPVIAWAAWSSARLIDGGTWSPAVAALVVATQPVLAKYAGAVTPDSPANACAAIAVLVALRMLVLGPSVLRVVGLLVWSGLAATLKDSTLFLVPLHALVLAAMALRPPHHRRPLAVAGLGLAVLTVGAIAVLARTTYDVGPGLRLAIDAPLMFAARVARDALSQWPAQLASAWTSLGGFGGTSAPLPATAAAVAALLWGLAAAGLAHLALTRRSSTPAVTWYLCLAVAACLLQAPVRQVLLDTAGVHQGRWLFPVAVPLAVGVRARPRPRARPCRDTGMAADRDGCHAGDGTALVVGRAVARRRCGLVARSHPPVPPLDGGSGRRCAPRRVDDPRRLVCHATGGDGLRRAGPPLLRAVAGTASGPRKPDPCPTR